MVEGEIRRRGRPSAGVTAQRQAQLLVAARQIFVRSGYRAARMDEVASAGGITKRTLYAWHKDKEALFRACVLEGALRFPRLEMRGDETLAASLERFVIELHGELSREESYRIGLLIMREAGEFPELADTWLHTQRAMLDDPGYRDLYLRTDEAVDWSPDDPRIEEIARGTIEWMTAYRPPPDPTNWNDDRLAYDLITDYRRHYSPAWRRLMERMEELAREAGFG